MAAEYSANALQQIASQASAIFNESPVPCNRGLIYHRDGSGIFRLASPSIIGGGNCQRRCCCGCSRMPMANYVVSFSGNVAIPTGGTVGPISLAIAVDGEIDPSSVMTFTPAAVETFGNVAKTIVVSVPCICRCGSLAVRNISAQTLELQNADLVIAYDGVKR